MTSFFTLRSNWTFYVRTTSERGLELEKTCRNCVFYRNVGRGQLCLNYTLFTHFYNEFTIFSLPIKFSEWFSHFDAPEVNESFSCKEHQHA